MDDDDDEGDYEGLYENGHWEWDNNDDGSNSLVFKSDLQLGDDNNSLTTPTLIGTMDFKDDLDLLEQQRFRKRFQRKTSEEDVITLQDVKDIVLYTAPKAILTPAIINVLHLPMTERFLRALIFYLQYYLQISDEMSRRVLELQIKVRTPKSDEVEFEFQDSLEDMRLLVAKEYCSIITGAKEFAKFHHMGKSKKSRSLSKKEAILFETLLRMSTQIVWLALGRKSYSQIELEVHRMFKSNIYNTVEHKLNFKYRENLTPRELFVLFGQCVRPNKKMNTYSPLMNETFCNKRIDYRLLGLGVIKYERLSYRLRFLERILIAPELLFTEMRVTIGILGMPRLRFDTMLKEIKAPVSTASSSASVKQSQSKVISSKSSRVNTISKKSVGNIQPLYPEIYIPEKVDETDIPDQFPSTLLPENNCNEEQRTKWVAHVSRLHSKKSPAKVKRTTCNIVV